MRRHMMLPGRLKWVDLLVLTVVVLGVFIVMVMMSDSGTTEVVSKRYSKRHERGGRRSLIIPKNASVSEKTALLTKLQLLEECDNPDRDLKRQLYDWGRPYYYFSKEFNLSYCVSKQHDISVWNNVFKILRTKRLDPKQKLKIGKVVQTTDLVKFGAEKLQSSKSLVVVRDPYSTLLSGYVEKALLGGDICSEVDFQFFLDKVITGVKLRNNLGLVFTPFLPLCRPCEMHVHSIIRHERFYQDFIRTINGLGIPQDRLEFIKEITKEATPESVAMEMIQDAVTSFKKRKCSNTTDLAARIWTGLEIKGVIPPAISFPFNRVKSYKPEDVDSAAKVVVNALKTYLVKAKDFRRSQRAALVRHYDKVLEETIRYIQELYEFEFTAFGYDTRPTM